MPELFRGSLSRFIEANDDILSETFHYDELNRLIQATVTGMPSQTAVGMTGRAD